ncbi:DnaB-like helicase C-terminal domain-containing protein [Faecalibacterium prausnitzii]|uniref:DnaB-like helicase C-terminal domain-containing protein n=1 Tax=Faecalibacterium prausnitzii TaxID=853 RepID=UPI001C2C7BC0|nr:DnaB-like helicase C-terminal domain-containing protein [Faecalibacterium prausnitzii]MBV0898381.1 AAA family ATPase [Faecalibacterium prausnitzii]MCQ5163824.1 DnaB helicase C-terminal domain-containing protein [Faecalibacterium prausnitzii]MCQ5177487.1 DnaB helicase C-terminal domain-containing protein [Faecalibacterium prausnitzii]
MNTQKVLLGALLAQPDLAPYSLPDLDVEHFAPDVQPVFAAVSGFWNSTGTLDAVQICERYPDLKTAVMGCFDEWSAECVRATRPNVEKWTQLILEQAALTKFQSLALQAGSSLTTFADLPDLYSKMGEALTLDREDQDFKPIGELVDNYIRKLNEKPKYIPSGIPVLDKHLHLSPGNLFIIGGRPSAGKTALSLQMACEQTQRGFRVCYFSLETDPDTLTARIIANRLAVPLADVKAKTVPQSDLDSLADLHKLPLFIRSASGKGIGWVKAQAQRMKAQVVFIDYLQLLADGKAKDRYQAITGISIALHELAQTTGILVVALAQLNRNAAHASPSTADLKESGQLEQDADAILLLSADKEEYQAILAKNKEGRVGEIPLTFDKPRQRFLAVTSELEGR